MQENDSVTIRRRSFGIFGLPAPGPALRARFLLLALLLALACGAAPAEAHKFHASLAEVEYDAAAGTVEVALRLFPDDLEAALGRRAGRRVRLDSTPGVERLTLDYVRETLVVTGADGKALPLAWVGMEADVDSVWVYVLAEAPAGLAGSRIRDGIFLELYGDQVNTVNVKEGERRTTLVLTNGAAEKPIGW